VEDNGDLWWMDRPLDIHLGKIILAKLCFPCIVKAVAGISTSFWWRRIEA
jgi:hypothetical protein